MGDCILGLLILHGRITHWPMHSSDKFGPELPEGVSYISYDLWQNMIAEAGSEEELIKKLGWSDGRSPEEKALYQPEKPKEQ